MKPSASRQNEFLARWCIRLWKRLSPSLIPEGGFLVLGLEDFKKAQGDDRLFGVQENPEAVEAHILTTNPVTAQIEAKVIHNRN